VKYHRVILQLVGDGPERVSLQQTACELGVSDQVFFLGLLKRDEVLEKVATATSFVFSSRYETFGVAVIEALALGKPVIATRCGGPESIIEVGDGVLVDVDDVDALSIAMFNMFQNYKTYNLQNIRRSAIDRFGEDAVITRLKAIYEEVLFDFRS
jgi:glycosyltransferase involved in cell wall biosynthesis